MRSGKRILSTVLAGSLALSAFSTVDTADAEQKVGFTAPVRVSKVDPVTGLEVPVTAQKAAVETEKASEDASLSSKIGKKIGSVIGGVLFSVLLIAGIIYTQSLLSQIYAPRP